MKTNIRMNWDEFGALTKIEFARLHKECGRFESYMQRMRYQSLFLSMMSTLVYDWDFETESSVEELVDYFVNGAGIGEISESEKSLEELKSECLYVCETSGLYVEHF